MVASDLRQRGSRSYIHHPSDPMTHMVNYEEFVRKMKEDEALTELWSSGDNDLSLSQLALLLTCIMDNFGGVQGVRPGTSLRNQGMQERLRIAWKEQSFEDILKELYPPLVSRPDLVGAGEEQNVREIRQRVEKAWTIPYEGTHHLLLFKNISTMKGRGPYRNICAIIQSSGMGKSRMVDEHAKLVYTLPINVRTKKDIRVAYPPPDDPLCDYLVEETKSCNMDQCTKHYLVFFKHLFSHATAALKEFPVGPRTDRSRLATWWHQHMQDPDRRRNFYKEVVDMCRMESTLSTQHAANERQLKEATNNKLRDLIKELDKRLTTDGDEVKIVIYIDEAHDLRHSVGSSGAERKQLDVMCSVLASFSAEPLFILLLSTQSSLPLLAPPGIAAPSERAQLAGLALLAPITETPFDCAPGLLVRPGQLFIGDLWKIDYLAQWGRPLWWTMFKASELSVEDKERSIIGIARMKLLGRHDIECKLSAIPSGSPARVAIIDVLLALDFEPDRLSFKLQTDMVRSHMRIAYSVPQHREYLRSGYSSEPVLAEAAAQQIYEFKRAGGTNSSLDIMTELLEEPLRHTLVDIGQRGEVVMRLLLMQAYMEAVVAEKVTPLVFSRGCQLVTFIKELFHPTVSDAILASHPDNRGDICGPFSSAFKRSVVRFTHFVKAIDGYAVTTEALFAAFARGMAFICHQTQKSVDIAIPILYDKTKPLQESNMTALLVQIKRRLKGRSPWTYQFSQETVGVFPDEDRSYRPYITLIVELGAQMRSELVHVSPFKNPKYCPSPSDTHPRYHVTAYGCSSAIYKAVGGFNDTFKRLLATRNFLLEHPREGDSRSAVMRMKPAWGQGGDSFHWVSDETLNPTNTNESETDIEGVEMGVRMDES